MGLKLFDDDWGVDKSQYDDTEITTTILYFSKEELKTFKILCKKLMHKIYKQNAHEKGNLSDLLLYILKKYDQNN
mgnify:CR=1 FL=1|tara:strand:+ start:1464 stop:1688 length:225 start_codon:yes stop_codon:yes gene_type:complete